jgi:hypothetical protein
LLEGVEGEWAEKLHCDIGKMTVELAWWKGAYAGRTTVSDTRVTRRAVVSSAVVNSRRSGLCNDRGGRAEGGATFISASTRATLHCSPTAQGMNSGSGWRAWSSQWRALRLRSVVEQLVYGV